MYCTIENPFEVRCEYGTCNSCNTGKSALPDMYAQALGRTAPKAEKVVKIDRSHNEVKHSDTDVVDVGKLHELAYNVLQCELCYR